MGSVTKDDVDSEIVIRTEYSNGGRAFASSSITNLGHNSAWVDGTHASLRLGNPFFLPTSLSLMARDFVTEPVAQWRDETGIVGHQGLYYQALALVNFLEQGLTESPWRDLDASVLDIETIAIARHQLGVYYPGEDR